MSARLARLNAMSCPPLRQGQEWWVASRHEMSVRLRRAADRGEVRVVAVREVAPGHYGALVTRLRPRRREWRRPTMIGAGVILCVVVPLFLVVELIRATARAVATVPLWLGIPIAVLVPLAGWWCTRKGDRGGCTGLHCGGCSHGS